MLRINIEDWELSGGGVNGVSYFHKTDPGMMLKFPNSDVSADVMQEELDASRTAYNMGVPTPEPGDIVTDGKRIGLMFHRVPDKISFAKAIGENPQKTDGYAHRYALMVKRLHGMKCDKSAVRNVKYMYRRAIMDNPFRDSDLKTKAVNLLDTLPDADTCIHGDLHFGNVISDGDKGYFIDMSDFCYGYPLFDLSMMPVLCMLSVVDKARFEYIFHCTSEQGIRFMHSFESEYFGPDASRSGIEKIMWPYCLLRMLYMEWESGRITPSPITDEAFKIFQ